MERFDTITGRYIYINIEGIEYRVYFEESGQGIPLVCLHTAGSDGQQWYHLLNDKEITSRYRVIAPDLPYHGKSLPPRAIEWWKQEYKLTLSFLIDFYKAFNHALGLNKPVYLGCSMGGHLAPDLALECPEEFRAVIGVGAAPRTDGSEIINWLHHPRISDDFRASAMYHMSAPTSPEVNRREVAWEYSRSAAPVFKGDLNYYFLDHDLTNKAHLIDTSKIPVYLLTGEYDSGCLPEETRRLAGQIKGAKFTEMKEIGHFAMCENFKVFRRYLIPVLDEIAGREM